MANTIGSLHEFREALAQSRSAANPFALLVGEGCSTTAGVPTAEELVFHIGKAYPAAYRRAREKNLAACLRELTPTEQRSLAVRFLDHVPVNPAHRAIAQIRAQHEADTLFESAYARYGEASLLIPDDHEVYLHWGNALGEQAKGKTGAEAERLLAQACQKYSRAAGLSPRDAQTEYLWGLALSRRAQLTRGGTSQQLLRDAMVHLVNAEDRNPGSAAYVLACLSGSSGDSTQVRLWLTRGKVAGTLPPPSTVQGASALQPFVQETWFNALFA